MNKRAPRLKNLIWPKRPYIRPPLPKDERGQLKTERGWHLSRPTRNYVSSALNAADNCVSSVLPVLLPLKVLLSRRPPLLELFSNEKTAYRHWNQADSLTCFLVNIRSFVKNRISFLFT